jgi:DNA modification methylase
LIKVIEGDCRDVSFPPNYFDTLITDPPYGLEFMGKDWDRGIPGVPFWKKFLRWCKPGAFALVFGGTRTYHRLACAIEDAGWEIRDCMMWIYGSGFPKSLDISKAIDKAAGKKREVIKQTKSGGYKRLMITNKEGGFRPDDYYPEGNKFTTKEAITDLAQLWNGWGTALKPAWEPIIVAMKPLDGTFAHNAEKYGVAGLWIDGGRINYQSEQDKKLGQSARPSLTKDTMFPIGGFDRSERSNIQGRWPANLILDDQAGAMLDEQSKGASRFFYCAKASKKERNVGLDCEPQITDDGREKKIDNPYLRGKTLRQNNHPTVKPLSVMKYLCKLTKTPAGGHVLDPFGGSGTTALACMNTGRDCTIIEKEPEYCEIIRGRISANE